MREKVKVAAEALEEVKTVRSDLASGTCGGESIGEILRSTVRAELFVAEDALVKAETRIIEHKEAL